IAGLHDICPIRSRFNVTIAVRAPRRAAADAASQPAWPPPITITSKTSSKIISEFALHSWSRASLPDAKGREDLSENIISSRLTRNLAQVSQRVMQTNQGEFFTGAGMHEFF